MRTLVVLASLVAASSLAQEGFSPPPTPPPEPARQPPPPPPQNPPPYYPPQQYPPQQQYPQQYQPQPYYQPKPERLDYDGKDVPGYHLVSKPRNGLVIPGIIMAAVAYGVPAIIVAFSYALGSGWSGWWFAPVVGPFVLAANPYGNNSGTVFLLVADGIVQAAGITMAVLGFVLPNKYLELDSPFRVSVGAPGSLAGLTVSMKL